MAIMRQLSDQEDCLKMKALKKRISAAVTALLILVCLSLTALAAEVDLTGLSDTEQVLLYLSGRQRQFSFQRKQERQGLCGRPQVFVWIHRMDERDVRRYPVF